MDLKKAKLRPTVEEKEKIMLMPAFGGYKDMDCDDSYGLIQ